MKTMKSFLVLLLVAMMPMFITSCQNDKEKGLTTPEELIIGQWTFTRMDWKSNYEGDGSEFYKDEDWVWEFTEDGEVIEYFDWEEEEIWHYEIEGKKLYTDYANNFMSSYFKIVTLTDKKLVPSSTLPGLFSDEEMVLDSILSTDVNSITPLEALAKISEWKKLLSTN